MPRGSSASAAAYIDSRHDQKSSSGAARVAHLDAAAQVALEGVRVPVDEARHEQPAGQPDDVAPLPRAGRVQRPRTIWLAVELDGDARAHRASGLEHEIGDEQRAVTGASADRGRAPAPSRRASS